MGIHVCTIIARNYLASAQVLFDSLRQSNVDATVTVLVVDDISRTLDVKSEQFEVLQIDEIGIATNEIFEMAALYNVTEFATAVKPWLIQTLLERWNEPVIYLDPDIMVFRSLVDITELAMVHEIVITPHAAQPIPRDDHNVSESEILAAGIYNLGFIAVGTKGTRFLEFWKDRLKRECISDPQNMRFVDQRWVDFAPAMFDAYILKEPTYNVAYWNLHYLDFVFDRSEDTFKVNGQPIHFFHFSGYDPRVPELLSKYQGGHARILFSLNPDLKELCDLYRQKLFAHKYKDTIKVKYAFAELSNGLTYDNYMRRAYRNALLKAENDGLMLPPNPFVNADVFMLWLNSPEEQVKLSRYLNEIYQSRDDLKAHFPDVYGPGLYSLLAWCWDESSKGNFDSRLIPSVNHELDVDQTPSITDVATDGIQIAGYFRAEMGLGEFVRNTAAAVSASGIPYSTLTDTDVVHRQGHEFEDRQGNDHAVNIICVNADSLVHFAYRMGEEYFKNRYTIGIWAWELEEFPPEFDKSFAYVDEVWANSEFTRIAIAKRGLKPVFATPVTVNPPKTINNFDLSTLGIPKSYTFLFCFDLLSVYERKNPLALIDAFSSAFDNGEGPTLIIKALNGDKRLADLEKIRIRAQKRADIVILDEYLDYEDNVGLFSAADCYVSLHRSEGLGLTIAEAMSLGKPVIATAYSGNLDFMNEDNSFLVPFKYGVVPEGSEPYRPGARWAEPDIAEAAKIMRWVYKNQDEASARGERARKYMAERHSPQVTSKFISERYQHAIATLGITTGDTIGTPHASATPSYPTEKPIAFEAQLQTDPNDQPPNSAPPLIALAARPAGYLGQSRFPRLARYAREILRKLLSVRDNQQQEMNMALALGTEHLARLRNEMQDQVNKLVDLRGRDEEEQQSARQQVDRLTRILVEETSKRELLSRASIDLNSRIEALRRSNQDLHNHTASVDSRLVAFESYLTHQLRSIPYMSDPGTFTIENDNGIRTLGYESSSSVGDGYANFEDLFRGPEDFIRDRQSIYLELVNSSKQIVDIGSGRGEFLDVLQMANLQGIGVDTDETMVARASAKGHTIIKRDAIDFLETQESNSISTIFSAQFIEHLTSQHLRDFIDESYRTIGPGGVLMMETVNPYSMPAFRTFWTDLTHEKPIFPEVLLAIVREAGFPQAHVIFPNGTGNLDTDRWTEGEYTVIAYR